ncbi:sugar ABC transporter ATP-binding protein [Citrobacter amalonaticus]|nr:sugar ABC transporter ATP-binding protein [Citrobacter amalonaticus]
MQQQDIVTPQPVESEVIIETRSLSRVYPGVVASR